jgi:pSer/pThr/pTyr-binding forkhead associated (FHA) protein
MKIVTIGRKGADIVIEDDSISRHHAELTLTSNGKYYLVDCGSSNGTEVNTGTGWKPLKQEFVREEDEIRFAGRHRITVRELLARSRQ